MEEPPNENRVAAAPSHSGSDSLDQMCVVLAWGVGGQDIEPVVGAAGIEGLADLQVSRDEAEPELADRPPPSCAVRA